MSTDITVFASKFPQLYRRSVEEWTKEVEDAGKTVEHVSVGEDIFLKDTPWDWENTILGEAADLMYPDSTVFVHGVSTLEKDDLQLLVDHLKELETDFQIGIFLDNSSVPKSLASIATETIVCDHLDSTQGYGKNIIGERAKNIARWFKDYDLEFSRQECVELATYCDEDLSSLADAMSMAVSISPKEIKGIETVIGFVPNIGASIFWKLNEAMFAGDREKVAEILVRQSDTISNEGGARGILKMTKNKLREYTLGIGRTTQNTDIEWVNAQTGKRSGKYIIMESNQLGEKRLARCFGIVSDAERRICLLHQNPQTVITVMATTIAQQVFLSHENRVRSLR